MNYYAQLDKNDIVISVSSLHSAVESDFLIPLEGMETPLLGMKYDRELNLFLDNPNPPIDEEFVDELATIKIELAEQKQLIDAMLGVTE